MFLVSHDDTVSIKASIQAQLSVQPFTFNTGSLLLSITVDINCNSESQAVSNVKPTDLLEKPCMSFSFMHLQSAHLVLPYPAGRQGAMLNSANHMPVDIVVAKKIRLNCSSGTGNKNRNFSLNLHWSIVGKKQSVNLLIINHITLASGHTVHSITLLCGVLFWAMESCPENFHLQS